MTAPFRRTSQETTNQNLHGRVRVLEQSANGNWIYVGDPPPAPQFQNGWDNTGGSLAPFRFRSLLGGGFEVQGSVIGGVAGTPVFTLPQRFWPSAEIRCAASDDTGAFIVFRVTAFGDCIFGF